MATQHWTDKTYHKKVGYTFVPFFYLYLHITTLRSWAVQFYGVLYQCISKKGTKVYPLYVKNAVECTQSCTKYSCLEFGYTFVPTQYHA